MSRDGHPRLRETVDYQLAADPPQAVDMEQAGGVRGRRPRRQSQAVARTPPTSPDSEAQSREAQAHSRPVRDECGDTGEAVPTTAVGRPAGGLAQTQSSAFAPGSAPNLPVEQLGRSIRSILGAAAPGSAAVVFEAINNLKRIAHTTEVDGLYSEAMNANALMGKLASKVIEMTVGKQLNINATVTSQTSIPRWDSLPKEVRDRFVETLAKLPEQDIVDVPSEGTWVPQSADEYKGGGYVEETDTAT